MPIIPLLRKPGPLADAAAPVLDNQRRPTVDRRAEMGAAVNLGQSFRRPEVNPDALTADTRSLGVVGDAVVRGAGVLGAVALKRREAETDIQISEADNALSTAFGEHAAWRASNPDPSGWEENLNQTMTKARAAIDANEKLHPEARHQISLRANKFINDSRINTAQDAAQQTFRLAASTFRGSVVRSFGEKNYEQGIATAKEAEAKGYLFPHEVAGYEADVVRLKKQDAEQAKRDVNELEVRKFNSVRNLAIARASNEGEEGVLRELEEGKFGDLSPFDQERVRGAVQEVVRDRSAAVMDDVISGIMAGEINNEAAVAGKAGPFFGPKLQKQALAMVKQQNTFQQKRDMEVNGVENAVRLRLEIQEYDGTEDKDGRKFFDLLGRIRSAVPEGLSGQLEKSLNEKYGVLPPKVKLLPELEQNISELISANYDPQYGAVPWRFETEDQFGRKFTRVDRAEQDKAINAEANVRKQMNDWFRANPDKAGDFKAAREQLEIALPGGTRAKVLNGIKARKSAGAQGETGPQGVEFAAPPSGTRVTSYAYDNDETPDSNSAAGIGAFVPRSEQEKIKRGEDSPYRLKDGDFAVSPDVEKSMKAAGIRPGDTVEVQFADGTTQTGRWMDRTADNLRGRWDFYQGGKRSKHGKEGGKVTGFRRPD